MRILAKFNLILIVIFATAVAITGYIAHGFPRWRRSSAGDPAGRTHGGRGGGMRTYTADQLDPLLEAHEQHADRSIPKTIPFYGATEVFNYLRKTYPLRGI